MAAQFTGPRSAIGNPEAFKALLSHRHLPPNLYTDMAQGDVALACKLALQHMAQFAFRFDDELLMGGTTIDALYDGDLGRMLTLMRRLPPTLWQPHVVSRLHYHISWGDWTAVQLLTADVAVVLLGGSQYRPCERPHPTPYGQGPTPCSRRTRTHCPPSPAAAPGA